MSQHEQYTVPPGFSVSGGSGGTTKMQPVLIDPGASASEGDVITRIGAGYAPQALSGGGSGIKTKSNLVLGLTSGSSATLTFNTPDLDGFFEEAWRSSDLTYTTDESDGEATDRIGIKVATAQRYRVGVRVVTNDEHGKSANDPYLLIATILGAHAGGTGLSGYGSQAGNQAHFVAGEYGVFEVNAEFQLVAGDYLTVLVRHANGTGNVDLYAEVTVSDCGRFIP